MYNVLFQLWLFTDIESVVLSQQSLCVFVHSNGVSFCTERHVKRTAAALKKRG